MKTFLNEAMELREMSVDTLSEKTGIGAKKIENYCAGKPTPSLADAIELAKSLEITLDEFVYGIKVDKACECECEECTCEAVKDEVVEAVDEALAETVEEEVAAILEDDGIVKEEYDDDDDFEEISPEYLLEAALHANKCVTIVTTSNKEEVVKLCEYMDHIGVRTSIYVNNHIDRYADFCKEVYYIVFDYRFELSIANIRKFSKTKLFESVDLAKFEKLSNKIVRV
jgi:transcriptional regulator with XRE-family HTH domain